jgi:hypothetical protein
MFGGKWFSFGRHGTIATEYGLFCLGCVGAEEVGGGVWWKLAVNLGVQKFDERSRVMANGEIVMWSEQRWMGGVGDLLAVGGESRLRSIGTPTAGEWAAEQLGFVADGVQGELLGGRVKRGILNCTRQWGKSSVAAVMALHRAVFSPGSLVLVMSPSLRQSGEFVGKVKGMLRQLRLPVKGDGVNALSCVLDNGSRIVGLPGVEGTMRGFSGVDLLIVDEAARVGDEQYYAALPMLAVKDGDLWLMSTPFGARGFFWREWAQGGEGWKRVMVKGEDCSRISAEFLAEMRGKMGEEWFAQEFCCEFAEGEGVVFREEWLERAMVDCPGLFD